MSLRKDPDEELDYGVLWEDRLAGDTIQSHVWVVPEGIEQTYDDFSDDETIIWIAGGTLGETYSIVSRITTTSGRIMDHTIKVAIKDR